MKQLSFLLILLLATSCQYFETEKISSDTFYEEEIEAIDWDQVDQYPTFSSCEQLTEKEERKNCFETTLSQYIYEFVGRKNLVTQSDLNSTVQMDFTISRLGKISNLNIVMDSSLQQKIPQLKEWLTHSIDSLPELAPAYKRGIPVETKFRLPIIINSEKTTN
ncbi:MAG: hypothetical protein JKY22_05020 [Flavobacteriaceae bacterium]|nr:hypothetical protein [Flavobacteriaceae bacterium]